MEYGLTQALLTSTILCAFIKQITSWEKAARGYRPTPIPGYGPVVYGI